MTKKQTSTVRQHIIGEAKLATKIATCFLSVWFMILLWAFTGIYFWFLLIIVLIVVGILLHNQGLSVFEKLKIYNQTIDRLLGRKNTLEQAQDLKRYVQKQAEIHNKRALQYWQEQRYKKARAEWKEAIKIASSIAELHPNLVKAYNNLGCAYYKVGEHNLAVKNWKKALELNPDCEEAYNNLGCAYYEVRKYELAVKHWKKALELNPDCEEARRNLELYE